MADDCRKYGIPFVELSKVVPGFIGQSERNSQVKKEQLLQKLEEKPKIVLCSIDCLADIKVIVKCWYEAMRMRNKLSYVPELNLKKITDHIVEVRG